MANNDGFKEVTLAGIDIKDYKDKPMVAYYLGKIIKEGKYGEETHHTFEKKDGSRIKVYGFTMLNLKLAEIPIGCLTKVTYTGTSNVKTKYGTKEVHQVNVMFNDEDRLKVAPKPTISDDTEPDVELNDVPF